MINIQLNGCFSVTALDGSNITPKGAKAQAIVAMLARADGHVRTRTWLQDKLWSGRGRDQSAASLRQSLAEIRRMFGRHQSILLADRRTVRLDASGFELQAPSDPGLEFLEGIDVRDAEFDEWLRAERQRADTRAALAREPVLPLKREQTRVFCDISKNGSEMEQMFSQIFASSIATGLSEQLALDLEMTGTTTDATTTHLKVGAQTVVKDNIATIHAVCESGTTRRRIWSGTKVLQVKGAPPVDNDELLQLANEAIDVVGDALRHSSAKQGALVDPASLALEASRKIFSMDQEQLTEADAKLALAFELEPRGLYLAWRIFQRVVRLVERHGEFSPRATADEIREFSARALELEPMNSMVLAAVSYAEFLVTGNFARGYDLARRSIALNPANPFGWLCMSSAKMRMNLLHEAHQHMMKARRIGSVSPYRHWWEMACGLTATANGRIDEALTRASTSHALNEKFRPPLRYLVALHAHNADYEKAYEYMRRLRLEEPDFDPEQLADDASYPVATLRQSGLIRSGLLRRIN